MTTQQTSGAVGLVLARSPRLLGTEPFFMEFIPGIEQHLADWELSLLLHVVSTRDGELAAYRRWASTQVTVVVGRSVKRVRRRRRHHDGVHPNAAGGRKIAEGRSADNAAVNARPRNRRRSSAKAVKFEGGCGCPAS